MKRFITLLSVVLLMAELVAQTPQKINYQAIIRDPLNHLVTTQIGMRISILQGSENGSAVYVETHTPTPNINGLVTIEIGSGTTVDDFSVIDWSAGPYFIKSETAIAPPLTTYTITGSSPLLSVPYAIQAKKAESYTEIDPAFLAWDRSAGISITESQISDLGVYLKTENDPFFSVSAASGITPANIANWNNKLDSYTESDPVFGISAANGITSTDIINWNGKLSSYTETDPVFVAWDKTSGIMITKSQVTDFGTYVETETDPVFGTSAAKGITSADIISWNGKLSSYTETDPVFSGWNKSTGIMITESQVSDIGTHTHSQYGTPAGVIMQFAGSASPEGYLLCQGQAVSRSTYSALFAVIGTRYGSGDGSTTFNLPDLRQRVPVGLNTTGQFNALGNTGGAETHTISVAQLPSHSHTTVVGTDGSHTHSGTTGGGGGHNHGGSVSGGSHSHTTTGATYNGGGASLGSFPSGTPWLLQRDTFSGGSHSHTIDSQSDHTHTFSIAAGGTHTHSVTLNTTGSGNSIPIVQPYIVLNYIIKY